MHKNKHLPCLLLYFFSDAQVKVSFLGSTLRIEGARGTSTNDEIVSSSISPSSRMVLITPFKLTAPTIEGSLAWAT